jgi:H/ACA ribonucleoprotein complex non-core subunit NAF1
VMEIESVLCNDQREVIGVIQDAMCKVDEPRYIVAFADTDEIEKLGLQIGSNVHYVNAHSKTVFTKGLRSKGTDASNIHDEELAEDEMDFSDDEKEALYKRKNKQNKKEGRGPLSRGAFNR